MKSLSLAATVAAAVATAFAAAAAAGVQYFRCSSILKFVPKISRTISIVGRRQKKILSRQMKKKSARENEADLQIEEERTGCCFRRRRLKGGKRQKEGNWINCISSHCVANLDTVCSVERNKTELICGAVLWSCVPVTA